MRVLDLTKVNPAIPVELAAEHAQNQLKVQPCDLIELRANGYGKQLAARLAGILGSPILQNVTQLEFKNGYAHVTRPVYAGRLWERVSVAAGDLPLIVTRGGGIKSKIVVGAGKGAAQPQTMALIEQLARRLGAAVCATRPVVEAGLAAPEQLVGQSGKSVSPKLYMACGISGSPQHLCGVQGSCVIAINSDPEAPIFKAADYGVIGDVSLILLDLSSKLA